MDGMLEQPKIYETETIPAEFPGADIDTDEADGTAAYKDVENDNNMAAGAVDNGVIVHGTPHTDGMEGTALPPLDADDNGNNIKEVDITENEPDQITDANAEDETDGYQ